ncbi:hypothetical protein ABFU49_16940 [Xanthomonas campestris pv. campestris]|nr:hypothetical protein [Xanthomonas campestris]
MKWFALSLLFWRLNFLLLSGATHSGQMYHEAAALAGELDAGWNYRSKELMTLYSKAKAYEAGEKVTLGDKEFAPDVPPILSSASVWSPIPYPEEIGREETFY